MAQRIDIQVQQLFEMIGAGEAQHIIDVRSPAEFADGHIPGAVNIPLETVGAAIPGVGETDKLVVVCQAGGRSAKACDRLAKGHRGLYNLLGGTGAWKSAGYEVEA